MTGLISSLHERDSGQTRPAENPVSSGRALSTLLRPLRPGTWQDAQDNNSDRLGGDFRFTILYKNISNAGYIERI